MTCAICRHALALVDSVPLPGPYRAHAECALKLSLSGKVVRLRIAGGRRRWKEG